MPPFRDLKDVVEPCRGEHYPEQMMVTERSTKDASTPTGACVFFMATPAGFEPAAICFAYHYSFRCRTGVCGLDYPFTLDTLSLGAHRLVSTPSRFSRAWLGIATRCQCRGFPEFGGFYCSGFPKGTPVEGRCSIQLSYGAE